MEEQSKEAGSSDSGSPLIALPTAFVDDRGSIRNLHLGAAGGVSLIECKPGTYRSDHYHREDWHYLYVERGSIEYRWRKVGETDVHRLTVTPGQMIFTPPMVEHTTFFPYYTKLVSISRFGRDHATHEADLVRVPRLQ